MLVHFKLKAHAARIFNFKNSPQFHTYFVNQVTVVNKSDKIVKNEDYIKLNNYLYRLCLSERVEQIFYGQKNSFQNMMTAPTYV